MNARVRTWEILETAKAGDHISRVFDISILSLVFLNLLAVILGSVEAIESVFGRPLWYFEVFSIAVFTVEYIARLWSCTENPRFHGAIRGRVRFALTPMGIIDLLAILPFYLPFVAVDLRALRVLRLFRVFRVLKVARYYSPVETIKDVFQSKKEELILTSVFVAFLVVISSTLLYYCENEAQPDAFSSIPASMWWAVATLTTVGYGDIYPITTLGKICASVISILGIGMFALPTGILGAGFVEAMQKKKSPKTCPHCGKTIP